MESPLLFTTQAKGKIALLTLNRPKVHNAVNDALMQAWENHLDRIEADENIRAIIISGAGEQTFCAGGDLKYFASLKTKTTCEEMSYRMQAILTRLASGKRVVIAAINGQALGGGCEILTACHFRMTAEHARFSFRQAPNGIITGWGGGRRLIELLGKSKALNLFLTADRISAKKAQQIGFVDEVFTKEDLMPSTITFAEKILQHPQSAIEGFLALVQNYEHLDKATFIRQETELFSKLWIGNHFQNILKKFSE